MNKFATVGLLVGGAIVGLLLAMVLAPARARPANNAGVIVLSMVDGACTGAYKTEYFAVSRSRRPGAPFLVVNRCTERRIVSFRNFARAKSPTECGPEEATSPFLPPFEVQVPGNNEKDFLLKLTNRESEEFDGDWCYDIWVEGVRLDPQLRIDR